MEIAQDRQKTQKILDKINVWSRKEIWLSVSGAADMMKEFPDYYEFLNTLPRQSENKSIKQIEKDVNRTFPGDTSYNKSTMRNILICYSLRNPNIGYCQGLNFIVATLLGLGFSEHESFWLFVQLLEKYLPLEYYNSMSGVILDQKVFDYLFRLKLGKLSRKLESIGIESCLFTVQWFICIFSFSFTKEIVYFIWDNIFVKGHNIVFSVGLATAWLIKDNITKHGDFIAALAAIEQSCKDFTDLNALKFAIKRKDFRVRPALVSRLRTLLEKEVISEYQDRFAKVIPQDTLFASLSRPCVDENECKQKILKTSSFFTYSNTQIQEIEGYLDLCDYDKHKICRPNPSTIYLSGKKNHVCRFDDFESPRDLPLEAPIEFLQRNSILASTKKSFAYISSFINLSEFE